MLLIGTAAAADPPAPEPTEPAPTEAPAPDPEVVKLDGGDEPLPSALDGLDAARAEQTGELTLDDLTKDWVTRERERIRSQAFVRPLASAVVLPSEGTAVQLGVAGGHRWWTLKPSTVDWGGEERLWVHAPLGGVRGYSAGLQAVGGPWVGPVGLRLGPVLSVDRLDFGDGVVLPSAAAVGGVADLTFQAGPVVLTGGVEPAWLVTGSRAAAADALPGDEWTWRAGLGWLGRPLQWTVDGELRSTAVGAVWAGGLSLQLRIL